MRSAVVLFRVFLVLFVPAASFAAEHTTDSLETVKENLAAKKAILIDVREQREWDAGHLQEAILVPLTKLKDADEAAVAEMLGGVDKEKIIYCHCASGFRVLPGADMLADFGYTVRPLKPGYEKLVQFGFSQAIRQPASTLPAALKGILLSDKRKQIERVDLVLDRMKLKDGDIVADIGTGVGYYALPIAERVGPHGYVCAVDIQEGMLDGLRERMQSENVSRIFPILSKEDDPLLAPGSIDWVILVDAYHEFSQPEAMLEKIRECLSPTGRVALLEYRAESELGSVEWIPRSHRMSIPEVMSEWTAAGFELEDRFDFLPTQHFFVFKPGSDEGESDTE